TGQRTRRGSRKRISSSRWRKRPPPRSTTYTNSWSSCRLEYQLPSFFCAATAGWSDGLCLTIIRRCTYTNDRLACGHGGALNHLLHLAHGSLHADQHRPRDDTVPDIQLFDPWNTAHGQHVGVI